MKQMTQGDYNQALSVRRAQVLETVLDRLGNDLSVPVNINNRTGTG
jgi:outer membrane protein OmpA-like peptidoglycan-associated protein